MAKAEKVEIRSDSENWSSGGQLTSQEYQGSEIRHSQQYPSEETVTETRPAYSVTKVEKSTAPKSVVKRTTTAAPVVSTTTSARPETTTTKTETKKSHLTIKVKMSIPIHNKEPRG